MGDEEVRIAVGASARPPCNRGGDLVDAALIIRQSHPRAIERGQILDLLGVRLARTRILLSKCLSRVDGLAQLLDLLFNSLSLVSRSWDGSAEAAPPTRG